MGSGGGTGRLQLSLYLPEGKSSMVRNAEGGNNTNNLQIVKNETGFCTNKNAWININGPTKSDNSINFVTKNNDDNIKQTFSVFIVSFWALYEIIHSSELSSFSISLVYYIGCFFVFCFFFILYSCKCFHSCTLLLSSW